MWLALEACGLALEVGALGYFIERDCVAETSAGYSEDSCWGLCGCMWAKM